MPTGFKNVDIESITLFAGALGLDGQWPFYNGGDAPGGAYFARLDSGLDSVAAVIPLPESLIPGEYRIFFQGIDYDENKTLQCALGTNSSSVIKLDDRDVNGIWSSPATINLQIPANQLTVTVFRNPANNENQKYLLMGAYITSNPLQQVDRFSRAIQLVYPTEMNQAEPVKGNYLVDGGFEAGVDSSWGYAGNRNGLPEWDQTQAYEGKGCIKIALDHKANAYGDNTGLSSRIYRLKPNTKYSLSMRVKASGQVAVAMSLSNVFAYPSGVQLPPAIGAFVYANAEWQLLQATGYVLDYPTPDYQIRIHANELPEGFLWIDNVQLEEGDPTPFKAASPITAGVKVDKPGNIFYDDESVNLSLLVKNNTDQPATGIIRLEIYDYLHKRVKQLTHSVSLQANEFLSAPVVITPEKRGIFRLVMWVDGQSRTEREYAFSVIPRPAIEGLNPGSALGVHPNYTDQQLAILQRLGMKWGRAMSPSGFFRWSVVEPVEGQIQSYDEQIQKGINHGITTLGTIGTNNYWPAWADVNGLPDLTKWGVFCGKLAAHYKGLVDWWEIWNEPEFTAEFYAQMLKTAVDAIEVNNPDAKIVAMGGVPIAYMHAVIARLEALYPTWDWRSHCDAVATHCYPNGHSPESFIGANLPPVWNTETGGWDQGFYQGAQSSFYSPGKNLWPYLDGYRYNEGSLGVTLEVVLNYLRSRASGLAKYFYYDSRVAASPDYPRSHTTLLEYDGTVRAKGIAYAIAGALTDGAAGLGNISKTAAMVALLFNKPDGPIAAIYTPDKKPRQVSLSGIVKALDLMGNEIVASSSFTIGRIPIYIHGLALAAMVAALEGATVLDMADTVPPNVLITDGPRGTIAANDFRFRWIASDETSYPHSGELNPESKVPPSPPEPEALMYSYSLTGVWSPWTSKIYVDYEDVAPGAYVFSVKTRDSAGNESLPDTRAFTIAGAVPEPEPEPIPPDTVGPVPGDLGAISTAPFTSTAVTLSWAPATDNVSPQTELRYAVYKALSRIDSLAEAEAAQKIMDWTPNVTRWIATGLNRATTYYFAVVVKDAWENKTPYKYVQRKTRH